MSDPILVNPYSSEALAAPGLFYDTLRERCPVAKVEDGDNRFYIVSGYENVLKVMNDHATWSKIDGNLLPKGERDIALSQDPPAFNDFRRIYRDYLGLKGVVRWADDIRRMADALIDEILPLRHGDFHTCSPCGCP